MRIAEIKDFEVGKKYKVYRESMRGRALVHTAECLEINDAEYKGLFNVDGRICECYVDHSVAPLPDEMAKEYGTPFGKYHTAMLPNDNTLIIKAYDIMTDEDVKAIGNSKRVAKSLENQDRFYANMPQGTKDRIEVLGYDKPNTFVREAITEKLEREENK